MSAASIIGTRPANNATEVAATADTRVVATAASEVLNLPVTITKIASSQSTLSSNSFAQSSSLSTAPWSSSFLFTTSSPGSPSSKGLAEYLPIVTLALAVAVFFLSLALIFVCCKRYCRCCDGGSGSRRSRRRHCRDSDDGNDDVSDGRGAFLRDVLIAKKHVPVIFAEEMEEAAAQSAAGTASGGSARPIVLTVERPPAEIPHFGDIDDCGGGGFSGGIGSFERLRYGNKPPPPPIF